MRGWWRGKRSDEKPVAVPNTREVPRIDHLQSLMALVNDSSQPNVNALRTISNVIEPLSFNIKQMGYTLARQLAAALPPSGETTARHVGLLSSLSTQAAIESDWVRHWCNELQIAVLYHRKVWELCYVLQAVHETGFLRSGMRGLGFGCGSEPLPSYFAAQGVSILATDLPAEEAVGRGWLETGQHATDADIAHMSHLVDRETFDQQVRMRPVDMNAIPADIRDYDFCWSICALEHLGSLELGANFIVNAMDTLRPGGVAVHTTEYNIRADGPTIDNWPSVAFQRKHLEAVADRLRRSGHRVAPFDFALGDGPLDKFVDIPPYSYDLPAEMNAWLGESAHLKLTFDGLVVTCVGLVVQKRED